MSMVIGVPSFVFAVHGPMVWQLASNAFSFDWVTLYVTLGALSLDGVPLPASIALDEVTKFFNCTLPWVGAPKLTFGAFSLDKGGWFVVCSAFDWSIPTPFTLLVLGWCHTLICYWHLAFDWGTSAPWLVVGALVLVGVPLPISSANLSFNQVHSFVVVAWLFVGVPLSPFEAVPLKMVALTTCTRDVHIELDHPTWVTHLYQLS